MLSLKKLVPLCPILLALVGCGKKVAENGTTVQGQTSAQVAPEIVLEATIDSGTRSNGIFNIPRVGDLYLTPHIEAIEGSANGYNLKVYVNKQGTTWEFYCQYKGVTNPSFNRYTLDKCYDMDGLDLGLTVSNIELFTFPLDQGKTLEMTMVTGPSRAKNIARANFRGDWRQ